MALGNSQPNINSFFNENFLYPHKQIKADDARHLWVELLASATQLNSDFLKFWKEKSFC